MRPFERFWFNLHRHNTRQRKDRQLHHIERALLVWPIHLLIWAKRRRQPTQPTMATGKMPKTWKIRDKDTKQCGT